MSTAIIHGDPGSYKTSALISEYLVPAVRNGRVVVTNIRGVKCVEEIANIYSFEPPESSEIILVPFTQEGFNRMATFFHWAPAGALILMDEGQRIYPTRLRDFKEFDLKYPTEEHRPKTVEDAFDSHRHMNWDIYISTTNIGKIHKEIRAVAEFGFRHKNMATVLSFMKGRYKRVTHNAENSGAALGHAISSSLRRIDSRCFNVYQSTATGTTKDSQTGFKFFKQPKLLFIFFIIGCSLWNMGHNLYSVGGLPKVLGGSISTSTNAPNSKNISSVSSAPIPIPNYALPSGLHAQNPFGGLSIYLVGNINNSRLFEIKYQDDSFITLDEGSLIQLGFQIYPISPNAIQVVFGTEAILALPKPSRKLDQAPQPPIQTIL